jgi:phenylpropionate dioxygenase-like ring-hydroxylating dioxygenase large terminal subunit
VSRDTGSRVRRLDTTVPMPRAELIGMMRRLAGHVRDGTTDMGAEVVAVPVATYLDPDVWQREMDLIFKRVPLLAALSCELPQPGDYKALDLAAVPVLVTRDEAGRARAFLNVCRHRGAQVVADGCGHARRWLAGFDDFLGPFRMQDWQVVDRHEEAGANWKICYDGYLEGYHFASLHRDTIFKTVMSNVMTYDAYGPHQRIGFARQGLDLYCQKPEEEWEPFDGVSVVCTLFPNVSIALAPRATLVSQLMPGPTPDRSLTRQTVFSMTPITGDDQWSAARANARFLYDVVRTEDYATGLGIQRGMATGANERFLFGRNELGLHRFHATVAAYVAADTEDGSPS